MLSRHYAEISDEAFLQDMLDHHVLSDGRRRAVVKAGATLVGLLTLHSLREVPQADWPKTTVKQVMIPATQMKWVRPDMDLDATMEEMDRDGVNELLVSRE
jgi:CBS domain-containing protein